jgi:tetratricopeptide (TPR) repeat protein
MAIMATMDRGPGCLLSPPRARRRLVWGAVSASGLCLVLALGWYGWRWYAAPAPPTIDLEGADPALADALEAACDGVRRAPYSAAAWGQLGMLLRACDRARTASTCFLEAAHQAPEVPRWPYLAGEALLLIGDAEGAIPPLRQAAELTDASGTGGLAPLLRLAEALMLVGQDAEAEQALRRCLTQEPDHPSIHLGLGMIADIRGDPEQARRHLQRCVHSQFTRQHACARLAAVCQRLKDEAAATQYARLAATLPRDQHWHDPWLMECLRQGAGKSARSRYLEQLEAQGRHAEAVVELRALAKLDADAQVLTALGRNLAQTGDLAGAEQALREALRLAPDSVQANYVLSKLLWTQAEQLSREADGSPRAEALYREAAACARRALVHKPDHGMAHLFLGRCLLGLKQRDEARAALREAVACAPEVVEPALALGQLLAEEGHIAEARRYLEGAQRLAPPDDHRASEALARLLQREEK